MNDFKEQHLCETEIYSNIINVFTVTFDEYNASLQNKSLNCCSGVVLLLKQSINFEVLTKY